jgi:hypothetical protein
LIPPSAKPHLLGSYHGELRLFPGAQSSMNSTPVPCKVDNIFDGVSFGNQWTILCLKKARARSPEKRIPGNDRSAFFDGFHVRAGAPAEIVV